MLPAQRPEARSAKATTSRDVRDKPPSFDASCANSGMTRLGGGLRTHAVL